MFTHLTTLKTRKEQAFTLIELLVVILIIGILIAVAAPSFLGQQNKAHDSKSRQELSVVRKNLKAEWAKADPSYPATSALLVTALSASEPQYSLISFVSTPVVITPVTGKIYVDRISADSAVVCEQSKSGRVFCLQTSEDAGFDTLAFVDGGTAFAADRTQTRFSSGATLADAVAALSGTGGIAGKGPGETGTPKWTSGKGSATTYITPPPVYQGIVQSDSPTAYWRMSAADGSSTIPSAFGSAGPLNIASGRTSSTFGGTASTCAASSCRMPSPILSDASDYSTYLSSSKPSGTEIGKFAWASDSPAVSVTGDMTIEAWFALDGNEPNPGFGQTIISKCNVGQRNGFSVDIGAYGGTLQIRTADATSDSSFVIGPAPQRAGNYWYHMVLSINSSNLVTTYLNGVSVGSTQLAKTVTDGVGDLRVGGTCSNSDSRFKGLIDEIALYDTALSGARAQAHFNASGYTPPS